MQGKHMTPEECEDLAQKVDSGEITISEAIDILF